PCSQAIARWARARTFFSTNAARARYAATSPGNDGEIIELDEFDTSLGGGSYTTRLQTERIKGLPAVLTIVQAKSGKALSILSWEENRRHIELSIDRNIRQFGLPI